MGCILFTIVPQAITSRFVADEHAWSLRTLQSRSQSMCRKPTSSYAVAYNVDEVMPQVAGGERLAKQDLADWSRLQNAAEEWCRERKSGRGRGGRHDSARSR